MLRIECAIMMMSASLPVALVPGLALGWIAHRLPRVRRIRCWKCGWKQTYPGNAKFKIIPESAASHSATSSTSWPQIVENNDLVTRCWRWTYDEIRGGRSADEVAQELIEQGWPRDEIDWMVDKCRQEVRDR
jgi:hypothetical protein